LLCSWFPPLSQNALDQLLSVYAFSATFPNATRSPEEGVPFEQVADILGNSPDVLRKHYGKWSQWRQANIDRLTMAHFQTV